MGAGPGLSGAGGAASSGAGAGAGGAGTAGTGGSWLSALVAGKGAAAIASGLLVGTLGGGALVAAGVTRPAGTDAGAPSTPEPPAVALVSCPGSGAVLERVPAGQALLVTGRSADGGWLQVYLPEPGIDRAWVPAEVLRLQGDASAVPVADCAAPPSATPLVAAATAPPSEAPTASPPPTPSPSVIATAAPTGTPQATPTRTPKPSQTPAPNAGPPALATLKGTPATIATGETSYCPDDPRVTTITVSATDPDGVASVTLHFKPPGAPAYLTRAMAKAAASDRWSVTVSTAADAIAKAGKLNYYVTSADAAATPKTARLPASGALSLTVKACANSGPVFTLLSSDDGQLDTDPLNNEGCGNALGTGITASATDPDGVQDLTLHFEGPGLRGTASRTMNRDGPNWYSFIHPTDDGITASGTISWWVVAVDGKGLSSTSATRSISVVRCDAPAAIRGLVVSPESDSFYPTFFWCESDTQLGPLQWGIYASDRDNGGAPLSVVVEWTLTGEEGSRVSGTARAVLQQGIYYVATVPSGVTSRWYPAFSGANSLEWTVVTTDRFGGVTQQSSETTLGISSC